MKRQRGAAVMVILLAIGVLAAYFGLSALNNAARSEGGSAATQRALQTAREALLFEVQTQPIDVAGPFATARRPGELPCPDRGGATGFDGFADPPCATAATQIGHFPWRTLGLEGELRDGADQPLWYAVSANYRNNPKMNAALNSDTPGTILVRNGNGTPELDPGNGTGAVAVIIAPGPNRALDSISAPVVENNGNFVDGSSTNGFINGPLRVTGGSAALDDRILAIRREDLMAAVEKRVAREVRACLEEYRAVSGDRFPWAAPLNPGAAPAYIDVSGSRFGRLPQRPFTQSAADSGGTMPINFPTVGNCMINSGVTGWWMNWRETVMYAIAPAAAPNQPAATPCAGAFPNNCLRVATPGATPPNHDNQRYAIIVAGRTLSGQARASDAQRGTVGNYLESENATPTDNIFQLFTTLPPTQFNDVLVSRP